VARAAITEAEAWCLAYMMDIESHTVVFLRDLLATRAAFEPDVTAFLCCWVYEELWHGEAFSRFLGESGWVLAPDHERVEAGRAYPSRVERNHSIRKRLGSAGALKLVGTMLGSALLEDFVALHMTWGAANELSTLTAYYRLIAKTENAQLVNLLNAIIKDERRHFAFYRAQARLRLGRSPSARRATRWAMDHLWEIVGSGIRPQSETDFVVLKLFGDADGRAAGPRDGRDDGGAPRDARLSHLREGRARIGLARAPNLRLRPRNVALEAGRGRRHQRLSPGRVQILGRTRVPSGVSMTSRPSSWSRSRIASLLA